MTTTHLGELAALATALCWTATALAFESAGRRVGSLPVNLIRLGLALPLLAAFGLATRGLPLPTDATAHAWAWLSLSGLVGFTLGDLLLFRAFVVVGARTSMLVMALVPPMTALIGLALLGEALSALAWAGMALTVAGVAWVVVARQPARHAGPGEASRGERARGFLLALGGAAGQAGGLVLSKLGMGEYDPFAATQIRVIAGAAGFVLVLTALRAWPRVLAALRNRPAMARIGLGALFGPFLGVSLSLFAVQRTATGVAATIMALVPVLIIPAAVLVFGERITLRAAAGALLAVSGVALLFL